MNLPNKLSLLRIILVPVYVVCFFLPFNFMPIVATCVFIIAALTDMLDGYLARKMNLVTNLGKFLDSIADKMLVATSLVCVITSRVLEVDANTGWTTLLLGIGGAVIISRELLVSVIRQIGAANGVVIQANIFGKVKAFVQDVNLPILTLLKIVQYGTQNTFTTVLWWCGIVTFVISVIATIISGVIYLVQNRQIFEK